MKTLKRISPKSLANLLGVMYAVFGFIGGLILMAISLVLASEESGFAALIFGIGAPVFFALIYGLMGWIGGYLTAWIYNLFAKRIGGIQIEVD